MTATKAVDTTATTVDTSADNANELPTIGEFTSLLTATEGLQLIAELKGLSETDAAKRIERMTAGEALTLSRLVLSPVLRKQLSTKLGETTSKLLVHTVCTKVQLATYEADDTMRLQSLGADDDGWGVYAQQAPLGGFGAEVGFVRQEDKDGKRTTQRGALGVYLRASDETRLSQRGLDSAEAVKAFDALLS